MLTQCKVVNFDLHFNARIMATKLHTEEQRFNDKVVLGLLGLGTLGALYGALSTLFVSGGRVASALVYLLIAMVLSGAFYWLVSLRLRVRVTNKSIKYDLVTPVNHTSRKIKWKHVVACNLVKTPHIAQWHGANLYYGNGDKVSIAGRNGLELTTKDGRRHFIGCSGLDAEALQQALA